MNAIAKWHMSEISKYEEDFRIGGEPDEYPPMLKWHMEQLEKLEETADEEEEYGEYEEDEERERDEYSRDDLERKTRVLNEILEEMAKLKKKQYKGEISEEEYKEMALDVTKRILNREHTSTFGREHEAYRPFGKANP